MSARRNADRAIVLLILIEDGNVTQVCGAGLIFIQNLEGTMFRSNTHAIRVFCGKLILFAGFFLLCSFVLASQTPGWVSSDLPSVFNSTSGVRPLSLAHGDFDSDGVQDLVAGYGGNGGGTLVFYRGNIDSIFANSPQAQQRKASGTFTDSPFFSFHAIHIPVAPSFLGAGDFDADGKWDMVAAAKGGTKLWFLSSDGHGGFHAPKWVHVDGHITAMVVGEINRADGLDDVVVATSGAKGAKALIFENPNGAMKATPEVITLPGKPTSLQLGRFGGMFYDLAATVGSESVVIRGRDRKLSLDAETQASVAPAVLERHFSPTSATDAQTSEVVATLPMRLNKDGIPDQVQLTGSGQLKVLLSAPNHVYVVNNLGDESDTIPDGVCDVVPPFHICTLRGALQEVNAGSGNDEIDFAIGSGNPTISPNSLLPTIGQSVTIDAGTQSVFFPGSHIKLSAGSGGMSWGLDNAATGTVLTGGMEITSFLNGVQNEGSMTIESCSIHDNDVGIFASAPIQIGGTTAAQRNFIYGNSSAGVRLQGFDSVVQGDYIGTLSGTTGGAAVPPNLIGILVNGAFNTIGGTTAGAGNLISANTSDGIFITRDSNLVQGNLIGTDVAGNSAMANGGNGVEVSGKGNTIGGTTPGAGNVISGNLFHGIFIWDNQNIVQGNFIGTDATGVSAIGNTANGVDLHFGSDTIIGGTTSGARNVISGNGQNGVLLSDAHSCAVLGNFIGTDVSGNSALGNLGRGVAIDPIVVGAAEDNEIGGTASGAGNTIAFNSLEGILLETEGPLAYITSNPIRHNRVFSNGGLGIRLFNLNRPSTAYPTLTSVNSGGESTTIQGIFNDADFSNQFVVIEFFSSPQCDPSGFGEGQTFLGSTTVLTDGAGIALFDVTLPVGVAPAQDITATATVFATNDTSEFSNCQAVPGMPCPTITLNPASIPDGTVGTPYPTQPLGASGGTGPYAFAVTAGSLPTGLSLNGSNGQITGTPSESGTFSFTVTATDQNGCQGSANYTVTMTCPNLSLTPGTLPDATAGTFYSLNVSSTGGAGTVTYLISAGLQPPGLNLSSSGALWGTPTIAETFQFTVTATDQNGCQGSQIYSITVLCPVITITPATLAGATAGTFYSQNISSTGGAGKVTYTLSAGTAPPGLSLTADGILWGMPSKTGTFQFTVTATDQNGCQGTLIYSMTVCPAITITPLALPGGTVGTSYNQAFSSSGGAGTMAYAISAGTQPPGLNLSSGGVLSGTPTASGTFAFTVTASDQNGCQGSIVYSITIACPIITLTPATLLAGTGGTSYNQAVVASGGTAPYSYAITSGAQPDGLNLSASGALTGTPTTPGSFTFTITATDQYGCQGSQSYTINIACPTITLTPATLPNGTIGVGYDQFVTVLSGGTPTFNFAMIGVIPGLSMSVSGELFGTPTTPGSYPITVQATDSNGCIGSKAYTMTITSPLLLFDDFSNNVMDWTVSPLTAGTESGGQLHLTAASSVSAEPPLPWTPSGQSLCSQCTLEVDLKMDNTGSSKAKTFINGWVQNTNRVELSLSVSSDKWILKQYSGGSVVAVKKYINSGLPINFATMYNIKITYDGANFTVKVNNSSILVMPKAAGTNPAGKVNLKAKNTVVDVETIQIY